ncbi:MAG TPA: AAA family ATPase [Roseiflexaceae bacterium]|nr:AAA family ATPase [Roseiflexaceae bacterium]
MTQQLRAYLAQDRLHALARGEPLPDRTHGTALIAEISDFTVLAKALAATLGGRRSTEALFQQINQVFEVLITQVSNWHGSVVGFAGATISCWFDDADGPSAPRAAAAGLAMRQAMRSVATIRLPCGTTVTLAPKIAMACGPARRFVVGDPSIQLIDALAGDAISLVALMRQYAGPDELLIDADTLSRLGASTVVTGWREAAEGARYALLDGLGHSIAANPWPTLADNALSPEQLRPWLAPALFQREQAGLGRLADELRPAVMLLARFTGIDYHNDEEAGGKLDNFIRTVQSLLEQYEGTLGLLAFGQGGYLYAVFGALIAHEDDLQRAMLTALDLHQTTGAAGELEPLQIGIAKGTLIVSTYGAGTRKTYGAQSNGIVLATHLMMQAAPGETLVSGRCQSALEQAFALEGRSPIRFRSTSVPVFAVLGRRQRRSLRLEEPSHALPLVGRCAERTRLSRALDHVLAGQGQVLSITGEAGVGKSRLVAEGIRLARQRGLTGYGGACLATAADSPYLVWEAIWRAFFDVDPETNPRRQTRLLERTVAHLAPDRVEALPLLGPLVGLNVSDNQFTRTLQPKERQGALHALLRDCLIAAAHEAGEEGGGLLLVLEDLHWIDSASLDLLADLAEAVAGLPALILLTYRPVEQGRRPLSRLQSLPFFTQITLDGLSNDAAEDLIRAKLALLFPASRGSLPPGLAALLTERAQGNPFYLEELLNYLHDRALNPYNPASLAAVELPDTLYSLVLSRLDQLSARQQALLKQASLIGRRFPVAWLHSAFDPPRTLTELHSDLEALANADLIAPESEGSEAAFLFKHVVTQQVAYESLCQGTCALLHERLANYLEHLAADDPEPYLEPLAYHYDRTDNREKQRSYHLRAGKAAAKRFANETAITHLTRVLELLPEDALEERFELVLQRERIYHMTADRARQGIDIELLLDLAEQLDDVQKKVTSLEETVIYLTHISECTSADETARNLLEIARMQGVRINPKTYREWGYALSTIGKPDEALCIIQDRMQKTYITNHLPSRVEIMMSLGIIKSHQGEYIEAQEILEEAVSIYKKIGSRREEIFAALILISNIIPLGRFSKLHGLSKEVLATARMIGDRYTEALAISCYGRALCYLGRFSESIALLEQADALLKINNDTYGQSFNNKGLGTLLYHLAEYEKAHAYLEKSILLADHINNPRQKSATIAAKGFTHYRHGNPQAALDCYREALQIATAIQARPEQAIAHTIGGLAHAVLDHHEQAKAAFTKALRLRRDMHQIHLANGAQAGLARLHLERHRSTGQQKHLEKALAHAQEILPHIVDSWNLHGTHDPIDICLAAYEVLTAAGDPCAVPVLKAAHAELHRRAGTIDDPATRERYLARRPHQAVIAAYRTGLILGA